MLKKLRVVCGVILRDGHLLAAQRSADKAHAHAWEFPGGKVKPGESDEQALARELHEELRITVRIQHTLPAVEHTYSWGTVLLLPFVCETTDEPELVEHADLRWLTPDTWFSVSWLEADIAILESLQAHLNDR